jgi:hypothetical protein
VASAMPASRRVDLAKHVHGRVQGVRVEASTALKLEQGRWTAGRTSELCAAATADGEERCSAEPEQMRGRRGAWGVGRA